MSRELAIRAAVVALALICGLFISGWLSLVLLIALLVRYPAWETLFVALVLDLVWFVQQGGILHTVPILVLIIALALWALEPVRAEILDR